MFQFVSKSAMISFMNTTSLSTKYTALISVEDHIELAPEMGNYHGASMRSCRQYLSAAPILALLDPSG